jgi:hypothetical protein
LDTYARAQPHSFSVLPVGQREVEGVLASFAIVGSQIREGNWTSIPLEFTCLVDVNLVALSFLVAILLWSKILAEVLSHPR